MAGVNIQTLRYYERSGLLPPARRSTSGYRRHESGVVLLVRFIMKAQEVRRLAQRKIEEIDPGLSESTAIRSDLVVLVEACRAVGTTEDCVMMAAMDDDDTAAAWCSSTA